MKGIFPFNQLNPKGEICLLPQTLLFCVSHLQTLWDKQHIKTKDISNQQYKPAVYDFLCIEKKLHSCILQHIYRVYCLFLYGWLLLLFEMFYFKSFIKVARFFFMTNCFVYVESFSSVWSIRCVFFFPKRTGGRVAADKPAGSIPMRGGKEICCK